MISIFQIKEKIMTALEDSGVFDTVAAPPDDRKGQTVMREPAASVFLERMYKTDDNGVPLLSADFSIYMKFLKIGVNDTSDEIETAMLAIAALEPASLTQKMQSGDGRSAIYVIEAAFTGCRP